MFKVLNEKVSEKREPKTVDIVKRLVAITAENVELQNHPIKKPTTVFNPSIFVEGDIVKIYGRIILGYFTYASAIAEFSLSYDEIYRCHPKVYKAKITVYPENKYDYWGVEDPRVYRIGDHLFMTYCGRTVNYFNPTVRIERTLPVTAVFKDGKWKKTCVFRMPEELRSFVISDKDAFLVETSENLFLFHRLHMVNEKFYLTISRVPVDFSKINHEDLDEIVVKDTVVAFKESKFEAKLGWATPPIKIDNESLVFIHGVDKKTYCYRVFAVLINEDGNITAVTPYYIMEPRETYEIYGDRPYTVFPCGAQKIDDKVLISYGASDCVIGIGEIDLSELLHMLDRNRLE